MDKQASKLPHSGLVVLLYYPRLGVIRGRSITVTNTWVFVDTNLVRLHKDDDVDIAILYPDGLIRRQSCTVKFSNALGTTLIFTGKRPDKTGSSRHAATQAA